MRVSFESGREMTSLCAGSAANSSRQHPTPAIVGVSVSLMQSPWATSGVVVLSASVPDPGWCCLGGSAYVLTLTSRLFRASAGDAVFRDEVLVNVHWTTLFDVWVPPKPDTGCVASSAAFELRKYSVPPLFRLN